MTGLPLVSSTTYPSLTTCHLLTTSTHSPHISTNHHAPSVHRLKTHHPPHSLIITCLPTHHRPPHYTSQWPRAVHRSIHAPLPGVHTTARTKHVQGTHILFGRKQNIASLQPDILINLCVYCNQQRLKNERTTIGILSVIHIP